LLVTVVRCHDHDGGGHGRGEDEQDGDGQEKLKVLSGHIHKNSYENLAIVIQVRSSLFLQLNLWSFDNDVFNFLTLTLAYNFFNKELYHSLKI